MFERDTMDSLRHALVAYGTYDGKDVNLTGFNLSTAMLIINTLARESGPITVLTRSPAGAGVLTDSSLRCNPASVQVRSEIVAAARELLGQDLRLPRHRYRPGGRLSRRRMVARLSTTPASDALHGTADIGDQGSRDTTAAPRGPGGYQGPASDPTGSRPQDRDADATGHL